MEEKKTDINSQAVQSHLNITQSVIQRMATNSSSCKAWCITVVSAILVILADKGKSQYAYIAIIPNILFLVLDTYYLALEKMFRILYNDFIKKLHENVIDSSDLFVVIPKGNLIKMFFKSIISFSVWPFYLTLLIMILLAKEIIL
ncbi:MAG: hypothetical protein ACK4R7_04490 [Fervidobacterium sp.]